MRILELRQWLRQQRALKRRWVCGTDGQTEITVGEDTFALHPDRPIGEAIAWLTEKLDEHGNAPVDGGKKVDTRIPDGASWHGSSSKVNTPGELTAAWKHLTGRDRERAWSDPDPNPLRDPKFNGISDTPWSEDPSEWTDTQREFSHAVWDPILSDE